MTQASNARELSAALTPVDRRTLLRVAWQALVTHFSHSATTDRHTDAPALREFRATFVTLRDRESGKLRGCRGETSARQPLIESVAHIAVASAIDDPRFPSVSRDEVPLLHIEISALAEMTPIHPRDVVVGRHGLLIRRGSRSGLLLPNVATEHRWDRGEFLKQLCRKAGLPPGVWETPDAQLYAFEADVWGEDA